MGQNHEVLYRFATELSQDPDKVDEKGRFIACSFCRRVIITRIVLVVQHIATVGRERDGSRALLAVIENARGNRNLADPCTSISVNLTPPGGQLTGRPVVDQRKNADTFTRSGCMRMKGAFRRFPSTTQTMKGQTRYQARVHSRGET